jgi:YD repeat-containing protein
MKRIYISISLLGAAVMGYSQMLPTNENYIHSRVYLEETQEANASKKQLETVAYYDGLGRPKQNIGVKVSPKGRDVVTHIEYDEFGRQAKDFLPIPQSGTQAGRIYDSPLSNASSIYGNEKIFSEKILENSPLNRLLGQIHQGNDWQNHPIRIEYEANTTSDRVKKFKTVTQWNGGATLSSLSQEGVFSSSSLYKNITEDEDGNTSIEFKNGQEQIVLVRKFNGSETADTYYIYNEYNQLAFVISPLAAEKANLTQDDLDRLCYQYRYDGKGRLVEKKLPAKGWEYMVYDKLDRLTMSQDAGQRAKKEWLFTRYDRFGRVAYTGIATGESRAVEQANLNLTLSNHVERTSNAGFTQNNMKVYYNPAIGGEISYPKNIKKLLSVNYYDEYPPDAPAAPENILGQPLMASAPAGGKSTKSLPLAVYLKNIENDDWSRTFTYYDQKARVIGTLHHNYLVGYTQIQMELDFAGVVQKTHTYHKRDTKSPEVKIEERFVYDHQNRLVKHFHKINGRNEELLLENIYDELGRISKKKVGGSEGSPLQEVDYAYNIRGWLTSVNQPQNLGKDLFGFELKYQNPVSNGKDTPKYNGNISQMDWKTRSNNEELRRYTYQYDDLNRLTKSFYSKPLAVQPNTGSYDEYLSYDVNGNIKTLSRFGDMDKPQAVKIDELSYTYIGNQLVKVSDNSQNPSGYPIGGGVIPYDENGNMMNHKDKGISYIGYNHLNLPSAVFWNGKQTFYLYRADGVKVKKDFPGKVTDYLDGFQYENGALQFVPTAEGYYDFVKQRYVYNYTDHLGNVRLSYAKNNNAALEILEENNYYPFGLKHQGYGGVNLGNPNYHYKYNGKELQENSMYDYGARLYMPDIGRWSAVDPLADKTHDPYGYVWNNPIRFIDPKGMMGEDWYEGPNKELVWFNGSGEREGYEWKGSTLTRDGLFYNSDGYIYDIERNAIVRGTRGIETVELTKMTSKGSDEGCAFDGCYNYNIFDLFSYSPEKQTFYNFITEIGRTYEGWGSDLINSGDIIRTININEMVIPTPSPNNKSSAFAEAFKNMADLSELGKTKKQKDTVVNVLTPIGYKISSKGMAYTIDSVMQFKVPIRENSNYNLSDPNVKKKMDSVWNTRNPK